MFTFCPAESSTRRIECSAAFLGDAYDCGERGNGHAKNGRAGNHGHWTGPALCICDEYRHPCPVGTCDVSVVWSATRNGVPSVFLSGEANDALAFGRADRIEADHLRRQSTANMRWLSPTFAASTRFLRFASGDRACRGRAISTSQWASALSTGEVSELRVN